jgi:pimeloyl-ACP methyl ester carboxylesterase
MRRWAAILLFFAFVASAHAEPATQPWLLHLPGIGGHLPLDDHLIHGLQDGEVPGWLEMYDWTGKDRGLIALLQERRHDEQSTHVAAMIAEKAKAWPGLHITLTCHSAGCGIAVWALEKLPDDVVIDDLVMMQSALSPDYDLSKALRHVKRAYALNSELDIVLSHGTSTAGTVDGVRTEAAGFGGYKMPAGADAKQYEKLTQFQYQDGWMRFDDIGDHIGPMTYRFARFMTAALIRTGKLPKIPPLPPATTQSSR